MSTGNSTTQSPRSDAKFGDPEQALRARWIAALAFAGTDFLERQLAALDPAPSWRALRGPEIGLALLRGRIGGSGDPFNFGETTIARAAVLTPDGKQGFGYVAGRDLRHAELAAVFDALLQDESQRKDLFERIVLPVEASRRADQARRAAEVAPSKVEFFTMVRGDG
jgi:alpha-D-ribose 1-methylphosphonate 5-triphosphate synthase subunit PhnG